MKIKSLLFVLATCFSLPAFAADFSVPPAQYENVAPSAQAQEESIPLYRKILDISKGTITSDWKCTMDNDEVYDCITVQFKENIYVIAADKKGILGEWLLQDGKTTLLWKKEGMKFNSKNQ